MELDTTIIAAAIGVLGTCLAALLASAGYIFKTRQETRRSVRKVLYCLLELRSALSSYRLDANDATDKFIKCAMQRMADRWGMSATDCTDEVRTILANHFSNMILALRPEIDETLIEQLESALLEMAQSHPILAFRIRGKEKLEAALSLTKTYHETVHANVIAGINDELAKEKISNVGRAFEADVIDHAIKRLNEDILQVAWTSGIFHYLRCRFSPSLGELVLDFSEVNDIVDVLMNQLALALHQPNGGGGGGTPAKQVAVH